MSKTTRRYDSIVIGEKLPPLTIGVTAGLIVGGAIASRDFTPVHHEKAAAQAAGLPDVFMNILTSNGYVSRFVTDWAGPDAVLKKIAIRLGAPAIPNTTLRFTGAVTRVDTTDTGRREVEVELRGATEIGDHVTGSVVLLLPAAR